MIRWAYQVLVMKFMAIAAELGEDGWELVAVVYDAEQNTNIGYFKKVIEPNTLQELANRARQATEAYDNAKLNAEMEEKVDE